MRPRRGALGAALLALALTAPAGASGQQRPERVQTRQYLHSHGIDTWHWTVSGEGALPALVFTPRRGDRFVHLAVADALGKPVFVHVRQEAAGEDLFDHFCATADIIELASEKPVEVYVFSGACRNHTTGFATTGTVTATFARRL